MKNILIVIYSLEVGGGAEKSATMVGNGLYEKGYNIKYLTFYEAKEKYNFKGDEICLDEKLSFSIFVQFFKLFKRAWQIRKYCKKNNIDTSLSFLETGNLPNVVSKLFFNKSKIVLSVRNNIDTSNSKLYKTLLKLLYPKADYITTIVKEETQNLIQNYGIKPEKISNIYNMFDIQDIQNKSKEYLGEYQELFNNGKFTFINIGRFHKQKNQKMLLEAFDKFHQQHPNSQLVILGDGPLKEELEEQKNSLSSSADIHFLGIHDNPYKFLANSDVYISSSSWEGMSRVLVESMACGLPIITTDHPTGAKEIMKKDIQNFDEVEDVFQEEYGILVPVNNSEKLSEAMELIYNNEELRKDYSRKSQIRAKDFDVEKIISKWEKIL
ncbi:glycosyltransferase [Candidatus Absconditicoccus praedator]|uniref:glycosyltransferase n=1 Tax=Candidatus Absconditicoccus praedator TaxID=2735562 RepID=UPI001E3827CD|nr:glycosyltransferase [Candidatus Absconditicoccus praedator]UFX82756.1 glycosyltransferase [Candidatus Absconditicoccus praedator]